VSSVVSSAEHCYVTCITGKKNVGSDQAVKEATIPCLLFCHQKHTVTIHIIICGGQKMVTDLCNMLQKNANFTFSKSCVFCDFTSFLYGLGQVLIKTMYPQFYTFPYFMQLLGGPHKSVKSGFYCSLRKKEKKVSPVVLGCTSSTAFTSLIIMLWHIVGYGIFCKSAPATLRVHASSDVKPSFTVKQNKCGACFCIM
jgi:hypothetical protein